MNRPENYSAVSFFQFETIDVLSYPNSFEGTVIFIMKPSMQCFALSRDEAIAALEKAAHRIRKDKRNA